MHDDKRDQFMDELLEASLKRYGGEEPRSGFEMRILAGIRTRERAAQRRGLGWALAACAGTLAIVVLTLRFAPARLGQPTPRATLSQPNVKPPARSGSADPRFGGPRLVRGPEKKPRTLNSGVRATRLVRPEQFPTPSPLTEQEKLLLAYVNKTTKPDLFAENSQRDQAHLRDLEMPKIEIAPLEMKPLDDSQPEQGK
jgi:hypothetical protein